MHFLLLSHTHLRLVRLALTRNVRSTLHVAPGEVSNLIARNKNRRDSALFLAFCEGARDGTLLTRHLKAPQQAHAHNAQNTRDRRQINVPLRWRMLKTTL